MFDRQKAKKWQIYKDKVKNMEIRGFCPTAVISYNHNGHILHRLSFLSKTWCTGDHFTVAARRLVSTATDQPHPGHAAGLPSKAAVPDVSPGQGGRGIPGIPSR